MRITKIYKSGLALSATMLLLLSGCSKDETQGGAETEGNISAINVTTGGFVSASPAGRGTAQTSADGTRSGGISAAEADTNGTTATGWSAAAVNVGTVTTEDAGTVYPRSVIRNTSADASLGMTNNNASVANGSGTPGTPSTRATDTGYATEFDAGDKIGLTVVKDGTILHNNLTLTYDGTAWALPSATELWYYAGAEYVAYYPYADAMTATIKGATDKTGAGIEAAIFEAFTPKTDQSAYADYTASDLMLWSGAAGGTAAAPKLDIALEHAMALVIVEPKGAGYKAPAGADWVYYEGAGYSAPTDVATTIGGTDYTPYVMLASGNSTAAGTTPGEPDGTYRILIKPTTAAAISGAYETLDVTIEWDNSVATAKNLEAATYLKYNITPPAAMPQGERAPQVGDYFYLADGGANPDNRILPSGLMTEATKPATDAERNRMGVVYWLDPADATKGRVVSLDEGTSKEWGPQGYTAGATNATDGMLNMSAVKTYIGNNGNSHTWNNFPAFAWVDLKNGGAGTTDYATATTGVWYLPAIVDLQYILCAAAGKPYETWTYYGQGWNENTGSWYPSFGSGPHDLSGLNNLLGPVGGTNLGQTYYWSSTELGVNDAWFVHFYTGYTTDYTKANHIRVRAVLAF